MTQVKLWLLTAALLTLSACTGAGIENLSGRPATSYDGSSLTLEQVEQAILTGMAVRGWRPRTRQPGLITAELNLRQHQAVIEIPYDHTQYAIRYVSSDNMDESKSGERIHRNYNRWVRNLDADIQKKLTLMEAAEG